MATFLDHSTPYVPCSETPMLTNLVSNKGLSLRNPQDRPSVRPHVCDVLGKSSVWHSTRTLLVLLRNAFRHVLLQYFETLKKRRAWLLASTNIAITLKLYTRVGNMAAGPPSSRRQIDFLSQGRHIYLWISGPTRRYGYWKITKKTNHEKSVEGIGQALIPGCW